jgi:hypothetical protein
VLDLIRPCRTVDHYFRTFLAQAVRTNVHATALGQFADANLSRFDAAQRRQSVAPNAMIDDGVVHHRVIIDHPASPEFVQSLTRTSTMLPNFAVVEMVRGNEIPTVVVQTETKVVTDTRAIIGETNSNPKVRARRQRCPAAVTVSIAPRYPGRTPQGPRPPAPAAHRVVEPAPIMKRRPTPGVV